MIALAWAEHSRDTLVDGGWPVEWHVYPIEHNAVIDEIVAVGTFVDKVLKKQ
jgi:phospholipase/carboxylesterase